MYIKKLVPRYDKLYKRERNYRTILVKIGLKFRELEKNVSKHAFDWIHWAARTADCMVHQSLHHT